MIGRADIAGSKRNIAMNALGHSHYQTCPVLNPDSGFKLRPFRLQRLVSPASLLIVTTTPSWEWVICVRSSGVIQRSSNSTATTTQDRASPICLDGIQTSRPSRAPTAMACISSRITTIIQMPCPKTQPNESFADYLNALPINCFFILTPPSQAMKREDQNQQHAGKSFPGSFRRI